MGNKGVEPWMISPPPSPPHHITFFLVTGDRSYFPPSSFWDPPPPSLLWGCEKPKTNGQDSTILRVFEEFHAIFGTVFGEFLCPGSVSIAHGREGRGGLWKNGPMQMWLLPSRFPPKKEIEEGRRLTLFPGMGVWLLAAEKEGISNPRRRRRKLLPLLRMQKNDDLPRKKRGGGGESVASSKYMYNIHSCTLQFRNLLSAKKNKKVLNRNENEELSFLTPLFSMSWMMAASDDTYHRI